MVRTALLTGLAPLCVLVFGCPQLKGYFGNSRHVLAFVDLIAYVSCYNAEKTVCIVRSVNALRREEEVCDEGLSRFGDLVYLGSACFL